MYSASTKTHHLPQIIHIYWNNKFQHGLIMSIKYQIQNNEISSLLADEVRVTTVFNNYVQGLDLLYMKKKPFKWLGFSRWKYNFWHKKACITLI